MPLAPGTRLGGYEIAAIVGAGGMGEVYRARDTRLQRDVAVKLLPEAMAGSPDAYARFEREAQAVAALSHPNILAVYDFGREGTTTYVVFELLAGASLRERLADGPLPVRKAIDYARQTADGLAAAHARGITHRDIKPDNLFVTEDGRVKILDFGLARTGPVMATDASAAATLTQAPLTDAGTILGTVGYMAPEQVRGQAIDGRVDLFALGAVLYEMCTGRRAFKGPTAADTMAAVLSAEPPELPASGPALPPALDRIMRRCLEKVPSERFQSARDLSFALDALSSISASSRDALVEQPPDGGTRGRLRAWRVIVPVAVAASLLAGVVLGRVFTPAPVTTTPTLPPPLRAEFETSTSTVRSLLIAVSPDGRRLAHSAQVEGTGQRQLVLRDLGTGETTVVPESVGGWAPSWSPRSDAIVFVLDRELVRFDVGGRTTTVVGAVGDDFRGLAWLADDTVVSSSRAEGVQRLTLATGVVTTILRDASIDLSAPSVIGARTDHVLALRALEAGAGARHVVAVRLADGQVREVVANDAVSVVASPGHLLLPRPNGLFAAPFDVERLEVTGDAVLVGEPVLWDVGTGLSTLSTSASGVTAFLPGRDALLQFEWLDATGTSRGLIEPPAFYGSFSLSPDGTRIVARHLATRGGRTLPALRVIDVTRGVVSPVHTPAGAISDPIWSPDGMRLLYRHEQSLVVQAPFASQHDVLRAEPVYPDAFSRDGRWLLGGMARQAERGFGLFVLPADGSGTRAPVAEGRFAADEASFSPDGRWIAYQSDVGGRHEVYVARFPLTAERWQISTEGGVQGRWAPDGRALYYLDPAGQLLRVAIPADGPQSAGRPERMFDLRVGTPSSTLEQYAVHGDRFLVLRRAPSAPPPTIAVVSHWASVLDVPPTP